MLNRSAATDAKEAAEAAINRYNELQVELEGAAASLYELRKQVGGALIERVESLINVISDHPKEFDKTFADFHIEFSRFNDVESLVGQQYQDAVVHSGSAAGIGVAAGAATAFAGPTAAMAVATTFGTAATGTAISSLSGAAATNAALAWLGGGALSAGGGGMAAGNALLALSGPIGWTAAGLCAAGGLVYFFYKNHKVTESAHEVRIVVEKATHQILEARELASELLDQTTLHASGVRALIMQLEADGLPASYREFTARQLESVGALVNHVRSLSILLNQTIESRVEPTTAESTPVASTEETNSVPVDDMNGAGVPNFVLVGGVASKPLNPGDALQLAIGEGWISKLVGVLR